MNVCAWKKCNNEFTKKTHNQKYCSDECCRQATNFKIMVRYYDKKERKSGKPRACQACDSKLSRYNEGDYCSGCMAKQAATDRTYIKNLIGAA